MYKILVNYSVLHYLCQIYYTLYIKLTILNTSLSFSLKVQEVN